MSEPSCPDSLNDYDQDWNVLSYEDEEWASPGIGEGAHAEIIYGYGEHGVQSPLVIDQSSDVLTVGSSSIPPLALPPATAVTTPAVSPDDFAAPPPLTNDGTLDDDQTLDNNRASHGTGHITPSQRGIAVIDPSNGAEYVEYSACPEEDNPELSSGSSTDSPQLDDTSERSIPIQTFAQFETPLAAPVIARDDYEAAVLACDRARQETQRLDEENTRLDRYIRELIQEVGQLRHERIALEQKHRIELNSFQYKLHLAKKSYGRMLIAEGDCRRLSEENDALSYRLHTTALNLQQIQLTLEDQHEEQKKNAQLIEDKLRLTETINAKTKESQELVVVIRKLGSLFQARLANDERDYAVEFVQEMYRKIKDIMYPDDPEAFARLMKATNQWGQA